MMCNNEITAATERRSDMERFEYLESKGSEQVPRNAWAGFTELHYYFRITPNLHTTCTFSRDEI